MKYFPDFFADFQTLLKEAKGKNIAVIGHLRPDGDCISSMLGIAEILEAYAKPKRIVCLNKHDVPHLYEHFTYGKTVLSADDFTDESFEVITVDCADYKRVGEEFSNRFPKPLCCIDHHASNHTYAKINILDVKASATAEIIAGLAFDAGLKLSAQNANRLYMGLAMDTRQFTTTSTTLRSFEVASALVAAGANPAETALELYQREKFGRLKLLAYYLQSLTMHFKGRVCIGLLPLGIFEKTGSSKEDTDGLVDYARSIEGVEIAVLLEELPNGVKGSLRAKDVKYQMNEVAAKFGGGGHLNAAGFSTEAMGINEFVPALLSILEETLNNNP